MTERNKKQIRFPVQQQADKEPTQPKIQYSVWNGPFKSVKSFRLSMTALRTVLRQIRILLTYSVCRNVPPWMFTLETEIRLAEVTVAWSWSANDQDVDTTIISWVLVRRD